VSEFQLEHRKYFTGLVRDITDRKRVDQSLRFLADASKQLFTLIDYRSTLQQIARLAVPGFADWCAVDMINAADELDRLAVAHIDPAKVRLAEELHRRYPPRPDAPHGPLHVIRTGAPVLISRIDPALLKESAQDESHYRLMQELRLTSYICVPFRSHENCIGAITFVTAESGRKYDLDDLAMAEELARRAAIAVENARLYQEVQDADRRKDEFLAMLGHELRNPLAPIRSGLDLLALDGSDHHELIQMMQGQMEHVVRLVDDLLDVSRIMRGKVELRKEPVEHTTIISRSLDALRTAIDGKQLELAVSLSPEPIWLNVDPVRLSQVVENLLSNAVKYTDAGGRIELRTEKQNGLAAIIVEDTGMGIEPELLPKVFDLFTQSSRSLDRAQGGLGIGLTLVKRLVELHGGAVAVRSDGPGQGSEFSVRLPICESTAPTGDEVAAAATTAEIRILVVDDHASAAEVLAMLLKRLGGHNVDTVFDGPSALETIIKTHPRLVLLDIGLPGMDGYQVARQVRQHPELNDVVLIALTGYGLPEDRRKSKEAGFDEHLVKPPSIEQLKELFAHPKLL
jgi:signal transduction histidine kinase/CheY-like chemotaxis protein